MSMGQDFVIFTKLSRASYFLNWAFFCHLLGIGVFPFPSKAQAQAQSLDKN